MAIGGGGVTGGVIGGEFGGATGGLIGGCSSQFISTAAAKDTKHIKHVITCTKLIIFIVESLSTEFNVMKCSLHSHEYIVSKKSDSDQSEEHVP